jgi:DNA-binding Lrp family transcriptional regulator
LSKSIAPAGIAKAPTGRQCLGVLPKLVGVSAPAPPFNPLGQSSPRMKQRPIALDSVDQKLLALLRENARESTAALARSLGLSRTTVQSRIERLERAKIIVGYSVRLSETQERGAVHAYLMITVKPKHAARVETSVRKMSEVRVLQAVSGAFDMMALAVTDSITEMDELIDAIGALDGVERTTSSIVLSTKFER